MQTKPKQTHKQWAGLSGPIYNLSTLEMGGGSRVHHCPQLHRKSSLPETLFQQIKKDKNGLKGRAEREADSLSQ